MRLTRRSMMAACGGASIGSLPGSSALSSRERAPHGSLGLVIHSFAVRTAGDRARRARDRFSDPVRFLEHAHSAGASGVQVGLGVQSVLDADALRDRASALSMYLEGIVSMPHDDSELARFEAEIRTAKRAGAEVVRTVMLTGRRYESFKSAEDFRRFAASSFDALRRAAPVAKRHGVLLAVENHKDYRTDELLSLLQRVRNDHLGICLDTGNSIALLEHPMEVVEALAPWTFTTHFKDMGLEEFREGFLLAEVPLGAGILDLPRVVRVLRAARPSIRFNVEMITRDPLRVPCLTDQYWATFPELPGRHLARTLSLVRAHPRSRPLPHVNRLPAQEQLRSEDENIRRCLAFARDQLGL
jgi:sugar phosphate isomerase/epimerase